MKTTSLKNKSPANTEAVEKAIEEEGKNQLQNIFLNAPAAIAIFEGPEHKYVLANKAYEKLSHRKAADLLGKSMVVLFPELTGTGTAELYDKVLETGESFSVAEYGLKLDLKNEGVFRQYYFNFSLEALKNNSGEIYGVMALTYDITEQVESQKKNQENEEKQTYILKLSDAIKELIDPVDIQLTACRILGEHVKVNRVLYGEVIDEEQIRINNNYVNGILPINVTLDAEQFGRHVVDAFKRNEKVIISDINTDPGYTKEEKQNFLALDVVANVGMGLVKGGRWVATFGMHYNAPRKWTATEIWLLEETAERTWAAVERAKAEEALRKSEEKYRSLFTSIDQGFALCELVRNKEGKGIDLYVLEVNPTYEKQTGVSIEMVLGKTILHAFPNMDKWWVEPYAAVVDDQRPAVFEKCFEDTQRWFEINAYPGEKDKFVVLFRDITHRKNEEEKQTYVLKLSDVIKELIDPVDIQLTACRILGEHVKVNRVLYGEVIDEEQIILKNNYVNGVLPINATLDAEQFGRNVIDAFKRNEKIIISDITTDPKYTEEAKQSFLALDVVANVGMGLVKVGRWVATFGMHTNAPRKWTATEIWLLEETAERTWAAVVRAKAEQELRQSEEKYRTLFTSINQGFALCELIRNKEGKGIDYYMLEGNSTYEEQSGVSMEMMLGKSLLSVFPAVDKWWIETYAAVVDNQRPAVFEKYFDITQRWFAVNAYPDNKDRFGILFNDITERKHAEEKIKESESRFRSMADASPVFIWTIDENGLPSYYNKTFLDFIGVSKDEDISDWEKMVHPDDIKSTFDTINKSITERCSYSFECRLLRADRQWRWVLAQGNPRMGVNNKFLGFVGSSIDITERKEAEARLKQSEKQLRELSKELEQKVQERTTQLEIKNTELVNMNKELEAFTYVSSHDLQEPLRKIQIFVGRILEKENHNLSDQGKNSFHLLQQSAERMQQLILDLLAFSRLSVTERKFETTDLNIIIEEVKNEFKDAIAEKKAVIEVKKICDVKIIPFQFRQLMHNLIGNALKFSNPKIPPYIKIESRNIEYSKINIENLTPQKEYCHISITDNGIGFEKEFAERIFEVFQKLHSKEEYAGTGIGLAIVKKIVDNHNGIINVKSEVNKGTVFNIYLHT